MLPLWIQLLSDQFRASLILLHCAQYSPCRQAGFSGFPPFIPGLLQPNGSFQSTCSHVWPDFLSPNIFRQSAIIRVIQLKLGRKGRLVWGKRRRQECIECLRHCKQTCTRQLGPQRLLKHEMLQIIRRNAMTGTILVHYRHSRPVVYIPPWQQAASLDFSLNCIQTSSGVPASPGSCTRLQHHAEPVKPSVHHLLQGST